MLIMIERITVDDLCQEGRRNLNKSEGEDHTFLESGYFDTADAVPGQFLLYRYKIGDGIFQMTEDAVHFLRINGICEEKDIMEFMETYGFFH